MSATDTLSTLLMEAVVPLPERWRVPEQAALLGEARRIEQAGGPDAYWEWVAKKFRWTRKWDSVRSGDFPAFKYFSGGMLNVCDNCVDRHAEDPERADKPAIIWEGEPGDTVTLTYAQLRTAVARFANGLRSLGVVQGDVVAIYLPNLPEAFIAIQACNRIGAIYTVLFAGFSADAAALRLQTSRAKVLVTADASYRRGKRVPLLENARRARASAARLEAVVVVDRTGSAPALQAGEFGYAELVAAQSDDCPCVPLEANAESFLIFTSGTESKPKGVVHSVAGFLLGTWANVQWQVGPTRDDVYWCAADVGWLTFPIQAVIGGLAHGATLVCFEGALDTPSKERFYQIANKHKVTKILIAPTALRMLRSLGDDVARANRIESLCLITTQGEPLDPETFHWTSAQLGDQLPIVNAYGQTETGSTWTYPVYGVDDVKAGSCGTPVPGHAYQILMEDGSVAPVGVKGALVLNSPFPTLARTVWDNHERYLTTYFERFPGFYNTSDEAVVDNDGHLWVLGRGDDVINVAAHRLSTMEIESVVASQPGVADAAVVGINDAIKGTVPVAFITLMAGANADEIATRVCDAVSRAIGAIARLEQVFVCAALPKTRAGKTVRRLLREIAETGTANGDLTGLEDVEIVANLIREVVKAKAQSNARRT
jgi:acetyl-CoA synthetase